MESCGSNRTDHWQSHRRLCTAYSWQLCHYLVLLINDTWSRWSIIKTFTLKPNEIIYWLSGVDPEPFTFFILIRSPQPIAIGALMIFKLVPSIIQSMSIINHCLLKSTFRKSSWSLAWISRRRAVWSKCLQNLYASSKDTASW